MKKSWQRIAVFAAVAAAFFVCEKAEAATYDATRCSYSGVSGTTIACDVDDSWAVISNGGYWSSWLGWEGDEIATTTVVTNATLHLPGCEEGSGALQVYLMTNLGQEVYGYNQTGWVPESNHGTVNTWDEGCDYGRCETYRSAEPIGELEVVQATHCRSLLSDGGMDIPIATAAAEYLLADPNKYWIGLYGDGPGGTSNLYWNTFGMLESNLEIVTSSTEPACDICGSSSLLNPIITWGQSNEELIVTSTFQTYVNSVMDASTTTIPGCYIYAGARTIDTFLALTSGGLSPQTIEWNMGTGTGATFEIDLSSWEMFLPDWVWDDVRPIAWNLFAVFGWLAFGWFIWNDWMGDTDRNVDSRKNED